MPESCYHFKPLQFHGRTFFAFAIKAEIPVNTWLSSAPVGLLSSTGRSDRLYRVYRRLRRAPRQRVSQGEENEKASICCKPLEAELLSICAH